MMNKIIIFSIAREMPLDIKENIAVEIIVFNVADNILIPVFAIFEAVDVAFKDA